MNHIIALCRVGSTAPFFFFKTKNIFISVRYLSSVYMAGYTPPHDTDRFQVAIAISLA